MYPISTSKLKLQDTDEEVGQRVTVLIGECMGQIQVLSAVRRARGDKGAGRRV